jgi:outer membrane biogenesis lipoprotein LolB
MELQEVKVRLKIYMTELRCELTGWDESIPVETLKNWIKKVDDRIIKRIKNNGT